MPPFELNRLNPLGSLFVTRPSLGHYIATREELLLRADAVLGGMRRGELDVLVGAEFPLDQAAAAQSALEGRGTTGKVLLVCDES